MRVEGNLLVPRGASAVYSDDIDSVSPVNFMIEPAFAPEKNQVTDIVEINPSLRSAFCGFVSFFRYIIIRADLSWFVLRDARFFCFSH
jgi:hypothetical protein